MRSHGRGFAILKLSSGMLVDKANEGIDKMSTRKQQTPALIAAGRQRPLHTRKSAWKLGWPVLRARPLDPVKLESVAG